MKISDYSPPWWMNGRIIYLLASGFALALIVLNLLYWQASGNRPASDIIDFGAKTTFGAAACVSLLVAYQTLRLNIHKDQIKGAFEFLARFDRAEERTARDNLDRFFESNGSLAPYLNGPIPPDLTEKFIQAFTVENKQEARAALAFYEDLALAIRSGYAHEGIVFRSLGTFSVRFLNELRPHIKKFQADEGNPAYYEDAMYLLERWGPVVAARPAPVRDHH